MKTVKTILAVFGAASLMLASTEASALTTLKQVQVASDSRVDLLFDSKVSKTQVKAEFFKDIIQLSLTDAAVYPAKISSISGKNLAKIFAYQYAPKLVRCRLTVKGNAEDFKDRIQLIPQGKILSIRIDGVETDRVALQSAQAQRAAAEEPKEVAEKAPAINEVEEKALLERVLRASQEDTARAAAPAPKESAKDDKEATPAKEPAEQKAATKDNRKLKGADQPHQPLAGGKSLPNPMKAFGKLALILGAFLIIVLGFKKLITRGGAHRKGLLGAVSRFAQKSLGADGKMIQVVSTHNLGPKKSIAVVRIAGRLLVLGITNESINLISQLNDAGAGDDELEDLSDLTGPALGAQTGATAAGAPVFSDLLAAEKGKPSLQRPGTALDRVMASAITGMAAPAPATAPRQAAQAKSPPAPAPKAAPSGKQVPGALSAYGAAASYSPASSGSGIREKIRSKMEGLKPL